MLRAALTGGIGTGKSFCLERFAALGAVVIDADVLAREAVSPHSPGLAAVAERFGPGVVRPDGSLNRAALGHIVFKNPSLRAHLEAIIHPEVYRRIGEWFAHLPGGTRLAIADIPLLFETGHEHDFERVIVVACRPAEQLRRVMDRDRLSEEQARARIAAQWPIEDKVKRADHVINTDGAFEETDASVKALFRVLTERG